MLPMIGVMLTAIGSGVAITKTGRYKVFPVVGLAITAAGIAWLTQITGDMSMILFGAMIFVVGAGMARHADDRARRAELGGPARDRHRDQHQQLLP